MPTYIFRKISKIFQCSIQLCWQLLWRSPLQWQLWSLQRALSARIGLLHSKPVRMFQIQQPVLFFWHLASKTQCSFSQLLTCWPDHSAREEVPTTAGCISDRHRLSGTWLAPLEIDKMQLKGVSVAAILEQRGPKALCVRVRESFESY